MIVTNKHGLSEAWIAAVKGSAEEYQKAGWLSMTSLIAPIRIGMLRRRHEDEIEEDVSDRIWMLLGSACHYVLANAAKNAEAITEERFCIPVAGREISMQPDRVELIEGSSEPEFVLRDFKITSVWSILLDTKKDWVCQLNGYAWGLRQLGVNVTKLVIEALIRDWSLGEYKKDPERYPDCQVRAVDIEVWTDAACEDYLTRRVREYEAAWDLPDSQLPECTPEERWARPDKWAIQKPGAARATKVCDTQADAERNRKPGMEIVHRPGEDIRCSRFCSAAPWCSTYCAKHNQEVRQEEPF